jgi:predicted PurR-regulated permease PerM
VVAWLLAVFGAFTRQPLLMVWVTLFFLLVVEVEAHVVAPAFYGRTMGLILQQ